MKIKDLYTGKVFEYGDDHHHSLVISPDGRYLYFENLQNGGGSLGDYRFVDDDEETIPRKTECSKKYGADSFFNIGGFPKVVHGEWIIEKSDTCYWYACSECGGYIPLNQYKKEWYSDFCPNCGAKMDGKKEGNNG